MFMFLGLFGLIAFIVFIIMAIISLRKKNGKAVRYFIIAGVGFILILVGAVNVNSTNVAKEKTQEETEIDAKPEEKADVEKKKKEKEDAKKKKEAEKKKQAKKDDEKKEKEEVEKDKQAKEDVEKKEKEKTDKQTKKDTKKKKKDTKKKKKDGGEKFEVGFEDYKVILEENDIEMQTKEGKKIIVLPFTWENLTNEKLTFLTLGGLVVKQNQEELLQYNRDEWTNPDSDIFKENASGDKKTISPTYQLINETDPIEVIFHSYSDLGEDPETIKININK